MEKSLLLKYIMERAYELKEKDGKKSLSIDYFMLALLNTLDMSEKNELPKELKNDDVNAELEFVYLTLKDFGVSDLNMHETAEALHSEINGSDYDESYSTGKYLSIELSFRIFNSTEYQEVSANLYLKRILSGPTTAIQKCILDKVEVKEDKSEESLQDEQQEKARKTFDDILRELRNADRRESSVSQDEEADADNQDNDNVASLTEIVDTTHKIKSFLLDNIYGQEHAVNTFVKGYYQCQSTKHSNQDNKAPRAVFLFAGPPGVGKTFFAEKTAEILGLPYKRFDMSGFNDKEMSLVTFCGINKTYKSATPGIVTEFVEKNPKCVLLFDEIEKAHINVIQLFLQILDGGRLRDLYIEEDVLFTDAIIIFTTNAGKNLYEDSSIVNLSLLPKKKIIKALSKDINPMTGCPLFPPAICSRLASGNVVMFNRLEADNLYTIAERELKKNVESFESTQEIKINIDDRISSAILFNEGGNADARAVKGRANSFFHQELFELFSLLSENEISIDQLEQINFKLPLDGVSEDITAMFENSSMSSVLIFAGDEVVSRCSEMLTGKVECYFTDNVETAKEILFGNDIDIVLCDVNYGVKDTGIKVLNAEDIRSVGYDFLTYVLEKYTLPVYVLQTKGTLFTPEELSSFTTLGVRDFISLRALEDVFVESVLRKCRTAYQQGNIMKLARENKALSFKTAQTISDDGKIAEIRLFDFRLSLITDTDDSKQILSDVSRPNVHFDEVIGAEDAKRELKYFVEYMKNPVKFMRKGVRSPRGILFYGPPGTGKTLLAKAMAGESGVTFLSADGNEFLKKYIGEGAAAIHSLFNSARKYAPSIIFIDEIDAIAKNRMQISEEKNYSGDVLTALLTELDGFKTDSSKPVFLLAATNYGVDSSNGKSLDAALLRRFDRTIYIDLPNKEERRRYLEMKLDTNTTVQLSKEKINNIAVRSTGMSLADLESVFEMALRNAIRSESGIVSDADFDEAFEVFNNGEKKNVNESTIERVARHEAGHALICWLNGEKPSYLTIVSRGEHGGYMQHANNEDKGIYTKSELLNKIRTSLGGRASEIVYYGKDEGLSTGASVDLYSATKLAEQMICCYGMDESVGMSYIDAEDHGGSMGKTVRGKVNSILKDELKGAVELIERNKKAIDTIVDVLMEKNHLQENEIDEIFKQTAVIDEIE